MSKSLLTRVLVKSGLWFSFPRCHNGFSILPFHLKAWRISLSHKDAWTHSQRNEVASVPPSGSPQSKWNVKAAVRGVVPLHTDIFHWNCYLSSRRTPEEWQLSLVRLAVRALWCKTWSRATVVLIILEQFWIFGSPGEHEQFAPLFSLMLSVRSLSVGRQRGTEWM